MLRCRSSRGGVHARHPPPERWSSCIRCMSNMYLGTRYVGHVVPPEGFPTLHEWKDEIMKRREKAKQFADIGMLASDPVFATQFAVLVDMLTADRYDDGARRERSKITLRVEGGCWNAGLSEPTLEETAWVTGETLERVFLHLETQAGKGALDWRPWPGSPKRKK